MLDYSQLIGLGLVVILWGMLSGAIAHTWVNVLTKQGMIFHSVKEFMDRLKLPSWLKDPIIDCHLCNAGQIALWTFGIAVLITGSPLWILLGVIPCCAVSIITAQRLSM